MRRKRRTGKSLFLIITLAFMIGAVVLIALSLYMAISDQKRNKSKIDGYTLQMATGMNGNDWIGDLNNLTGFSRELVFTSRQAHDTTIKEQARLKPLAQLLLDESRLSAQSMETEKQTLLQYFSDLVKVSISIANREMLANRGLKLPWAAAELTEIQTVDIGYIDGVPSNVSAPSEAGIPELRKFDSDHSYFEVKSGLYNANINAQLPAPDDDLKFEFCSLPAAVDGKISPTRMATAEEFKKLLTIEPNKLADLTKCKALPSAVQVQALKKISSRPGDTRVENPDAVSATAACRGGTLSLK